LIGPLYIRKPRTHPATFSSIWLSLATLAKSSLIASSSLRKKAAGGSLRDFYIRESLSFIEQHYQDEIGIEEIAAFCHLDRSYLGKVFKSMLHTNPQEFLIRYRINKSCELMKITDRTINEIRLMVG
jgi:AraC-like DNA-binding protein